MKETEKAAQVATVEKEKAPVEQLSETALTLQSFRKAVNEKFDELEKRIDGKKQPELDAETQKRIEKILEGSEKAISTLEKTNAANLSVRVEKLEKGFAVMEDADIFTNFLVRLERIETAIFG